MVGVGAVEPLLDRIGAAKRLAHRADEQPPARAIVATLGGDRGGGIGGSVPASGGASCAAAINAQTSIVPSIARTPSLSAKR